MRILALAILVVSNISATWVAGMEPPTRRVKKSVPSEKGKKGGKGKKFPSKIGGKKGKKCGKRANDDRKKLLECVTVEAVRFHQAAFQMAADINGGNREAGLPGYDASVEHVAETLEAAGYEAVVLQAFDFTFYPPVFLQQTVPEVTQEYETCTFTGSGSSEGEGKVFPVDLALNTTQWPNDPETSTSGCEETDFAGLDFSGPFDIALIQRGGCFFSTKATNAEAAGAEAVIIFNQGNTPERRMIFCGTAEFLPDGSPSNIGIRVIGVSFTDALALSQPGSVASIKADPVEERPLVNVFAELPGSDMGENVVMLGAHLDSAQDSPGINNDGSGSAAILEVAVQMAKVKPVNTVRFAWWGAGEAASIGAYDYVEGLSEEEMRRIALYLNFDMIGSPNYVYFIYDGDDSDTGDIIDFPDGPGTPWPQGSAYIEEVFENFFKEMGQPFKGTDLLGSSDYAPFILAGIPSGGLFTGSDEIKTEEEVEIWGGIAGEQYDPCHRLACDNFENINLEALEMNAKAIALSVLQHAMDDGLRGSLSSQGTQKQGLQVAPGGSPDEKEQQNLVKLSKRLHWGQMSNI